MDIENLVIIGSGPAGYTASIYAARANLHPLLITGFEKGGIAGGQLMTTTFVENYPGFPNGVKGPELMDLFKSQAVRWGTRLCETDVEQVDFSNRPFSIITSEKGCIKSHSIIIATGASANRLNLPNEKDFWSKGISACAICDGATPQFKNERLAVVGGGDSACEEAVYLTKYGSHVDLIVRSFELKASAAMAERVKDNPQITINWGSVLIGLKGKDWLESLIIKNIKEDKEKEIKARGLFYAIGHTPNTKFLANQLKVDSKGYLITKEGRPETPVEGVFAAGDVTDSEWRQGITAAGSGCKAALCAEKWLSANNLSTQIKRTSVEPRKVEEPEKLEVSNENNFDSNSIWQKGNYALRKLYYESNSPLIVLFSSRNCGPCHILKPQLKRVLKDLNGKAKGIEIDIEDDEEIAIQAGIEGTPSIQLFYKKELKGQWKGVKQRSIFLDAINKILIEND